MTYSPEKVRNRCREIANRPEPTQVSRGFMGLITGKLNLALSPDNDSINEIVNMNRKLVLAWLFLDPAQVFLPMSSKLLIPQQWNALSRWQSFFKPNEGYVDRPTFREEARWILNRARYDYDWTMREAVYGYTPIFEKCLNRWHEQGGMVEEAQSLGGVLVEETPDVDPIVSEILNFI